MVDGGDVSSGIAERLEARTTETVHDQLSFDEEAGPDEPPVVDPAHEPEERLILTVPEVAELLGVSAWLVHQQVALGVIPCVRLGRRILIPRSP